MTHQKIHVICCGKGALQKIGHHLNESHIQTTVVVSVNFVKTNGTTLCTVTKEFVASSELASSQKNGQLYNFCQVQT